jgi:hypothetical protein
MHEALGSIPALKKEKKAKKGTRNTSEDPIVKYYELKNCFVNTTGILRMIVVRVVY